MSDKKANAEWMIKFLEAVWNQKTISFHTKDYLYVLTKPDPSQSVWKEVSFTFLDGGLELKDVDPEKALMLLIEEMQGGIGAYSEYNTPLVKDAEQLKKALDELREIK